MPSLAALGGDSKSRARELDLLRYQAAELRAAAIVGGDEDAALEVEYDELAGAVEYRELGGAGGRRADRRRRRRRFDRGGAAGARRQGTVRRTGGSAARR